MVAGVEIRIVAEDGTVLPRDGKTVGEFEIRGPWITGSYFGEDDPEKFRDGWLRTGDIGTLDGEGFMVVSDRTKDVIKSGGEWISSVELEVTVMAHPAVFEAAVIAVPDERWQERPLCCVVLQPDATASADELRGVPRRARGQVVAARALDVHRDRARRPASASSTRRCCAPSTPTGELDVVVRRLVESLEGLADEVAALERRVADAIYDTVRAQLRADDADDAKELERQLSKVRRSLQKAEHLLRHRRGRLERRVVDEVDDPPQVHVVASVEVERDRRVVFELGSRRPRRTSARADVRVRDLTRDRRGSRSAPRDPQRS